VKNTYFREFYNFDPEKPLKFKIGLIGFFVAKIKKNTKDQNHTKPVPK